MNILQKSAIIACRTHLISSSIFGRDFDSTFEYVGLLFRDLFLYSFFNKFWIHFGSKDGLSELRQITPGTTLGAATWIFGLEDTAKAPQGDFCVLIWRLFGRFFNLVASVLT